MNLKHVLPLSCVLLACSTPLAHAGSFIFSGDSTPDRITHPSGYTGTGGELTVGVCIDSTSANALEMLAPTRNIIETFNQNTALTGNLYTGSSNSIPSGFVDYESVAIHELGHCIGLAHPNAATESGLPSADRNYTKAGDGVDNVLNIAAGVDGIKGSLDDVRGDDISLHWFKSADNDPCALYSGTIDASTFKRPLADLPVGHLFPANADRTVCSNLGYASTEAVMQQGSFSDEDQRGITQDDVSTLALAKSGLDEIEGTADDYTLNLEFLGLVDNPNSNPACDIVIDFDNSQTGFAVCQTSGAFITSTHLRITNADFFFNTGFNWYFNDNICSHGPQTQGTTMALNTMTITDAQRYLASNIIESSDFVVEEGACVDFSAANKVHLGPGFAVKGGARFRAESY